MTQSLSRVPLHRSRLIRQLADLDIGADDASKQDVAERLGQWLGVTDAITLSGLLSREFDTSAAASFAAPSRALLADVEQKLAQARATLTKAIDDHCAPAVIAGRASLPEAAPETAAQIANVCLPLHRYLLARQRDMGLIVGPLREATRQALYRASPKLERLAALDAVFDKALFAHEHKSLSTLPLLLEKRVAQLAAMLRDSTLPDTTQSAAAGWLAALSQTLRETLLAELDVRLLPINGLIDAFRHEVNNAT